MIIPQALMDKHLPEAAGCRFLGRPLGDLTKEELMVALVMLENRRREDQANLEHEQEFLQSLDQSGRFGTRKPIMSRMPLFGLFGVFR